ncbi:hypothetical protein PG994_004335 [Apiospora phragmitis]|uniref:Uncharacterized protein n=1 Tax=Apiospora phragmitis TaxID=2905665 RepID=A0ABR1VQB6_9PEZI
MKEPGMPIRRIGACLPRPRHASRGAAMWLASDGQYVRVNSRNGESYVTTEMVAREIIDVRIPLAFTKPPVTIYPGFWLRNLNCATSRYHFNKLERVHAPEQDRMRLPNDRVGNAGII